MRCGSTLRTRGTSDLLFIVWISVEVRNVLLIPFSRLRLIAPVIKDHGIDYERGKFQDKLRDGTVTLERTQVRCALTLPCMCARTHQHTRPLTRVFGDDCLSFPA